MVRWVVIYALLIRAISVADAQEAFSDALLPAADEQAVAAPAQDDSSIALAQSTPAQSAWLDLRQHVDANFTTQTAPAWVQGVRMTAGADQNGGAKMKVFHRRSV